MSLECFFLLPPLTLGIPSSGTFFMEYAFNYSLPQFLFLLPLIPQKGSFCFLNSLGSWLKTVRHLIQSFKPTLQYRHTFLNLSGLLKYPLMFSFFFRIIAIWVCLLLNTYQNITNEYLPKLSKTLRCVRYDKS